MAGAGGWRVAAECACGSDKLRKSRGMASAHLECFKKNRGHS